MKLLAIFWDYDGTIVDSNTKNYIVNKEIFTTISKKKLPVALSSAEQFSLAYHQSLNFYDLYKKHLSYTDKQITKAAKLWSKFHQKNNLDISIIPHIPEVIAKLSFVPQAICSQNCCDVIKNTLTKHNLISYFNEIIGYNNLSIPQQKPDPYTFVKCYQKLKLDSNGIMVYIGDHQIDLQFAKNAERALNQINKQIKVYSIAACYQENNNVKDWAHQPDYLAYTPHDILVYLNQLC